MKKIRLIIFALFIVIASMGESNSQTYLEKDLRNLIKDNYKPDINNFIMDKVVNNRIIFIADEGHGNHIFMQMVVNYLNYWIDSLQKNLGGQNNLPRNLYLILESDSNQINSIYKYFETDNPYYLLHPEFIYGNQYTSAVIEFYNDLRKIHNRINSINKNLSNDNKIYFKLFGPEKVIDLNNWSTEKRDNFFLHERDEYSSGQIINLLDKDSTAKALLFCGGGHLVTVKTQKLQGNKEQGYFIGHYLYEHYKDNGGYYSIDQLSAFQSYWLNNSYKCTDKNYVIENSIFDGHAIPNNIQPQRANASIILFDKSINQSHISKIWSDNLVDCFLNNVNNFIGLSSEFDRGIIYAWIHYLSIISGNELDNVNFNDSLSIAKEINKWKEWRVNKNTNVTEEIINQNIIKNRIRLFEKSKYPAAGTDEYILGNVLLNVKVWYDTGASPRVRTKGYYEYIQKYSKPIIAENLINLLWVGTNEERETALNYLKKTFTSDLNTAKEWTEWWRNSEYCN